jgi:hypothetical protein
MHWKLTLTKEEGRVELWQGEVIRAWRNWTENRDTGREILRALESILEEQDMVFGVVPEFQTELDLPPHATARRIAETIQNTYTAFAVL